MHVLHDTALLIGIQFDSFSSRYMPVSSLFHQPRAQMRCTNPLDSRHPKILGIAPVPGKLYTCRQPPVRLFVTIKSSIGASIFASRQARRAQPARNNGMTSEFMVYVDRITLLKLLWSITRRTLSRGNAENSHKNCHF